MKRSKSKRTDLDKTFRLDINTTWITHLSKTQIFTLFPWNFSWNCPSLRSNGQRGSAEVLHGAGTGQELRLPPPSTAGLSWFLLKKTPDSGKPRVCHKLLLSSSTSSCWSPSPTANSLSKTLWSFILKWDFITQAPSRQLNNKDFTISPKWRKCFVGAAMIS